MAGELCAAGVECVGGRRREGWGRLWSVGAVIVLREECVVAFETDWPKGIVHPGSSLGTAGPVIGTFGVVFRIALQCWFHE